jgi:hypothetical protein
MKDPTQRNSESGKIEKRYGHTSTPFRDTPTAWGGNTLAQSYEQTMFRLEHIAQAGYQVKAQWECEFVLPEDVEMEESMPLRTRDTLYGGRTEAMRLHHRVKEGEETIQ